MAERRAPAFYTIPAHRAFSDALTAGLLALHGRADGGLALARGIVLLPNNRAVRAVRDAFVRASGSGLLLPRLVPVGDIDLDEMLFIGDRLDPDGNDYPVLALGVPCHAVEGWEDTADYLDRLLPTLPARA